jgi:hypothetical protein
MEEQEEVVKTKTPIENEVDPRIGESSQEPSIGEPAQDSTREVSQ